MKKKILSFTLASLMAISSTCVAFATDETSNPATGTIEGDGDIEGFVDTNVFTVTLPTVADADFIIDPQELILNTASPAPKVDNNDMATGYGDKLLFKKGSDYLTKSEDIVVINKSTFDIDVSITTSVTGLTGGTGNATYEIALVDSATDNLTGVATEGTWLDLKLTPTPGTATADVFDPGAAGTAKQILGTSTTLVQKVAAISDITAAYEYKKDGSTYSYSLKADVSTVDFNAVGFNLSGTINDAADWTNFNADTSAALKATLAYTVDRHYDAPQLTPATISAAYDKYTTATDLAIFTYTLGNKTAEDIALYAGSDATGTALTADTDYTAADGTIKLKGTYLDSVAVGSATFCLKIDDVTETVTFTVSSTSPEVLTTDGTNDIVIEIEETSVTSISLTSVSKSKTQAFTADATQWSFDSEDKLLTIEGTWLAKFKASSTWGAGSYKVTVGGSEYTFTIS
ncbi:MAG: hypothetical protein E7270_03950 [Lachnospiraceae bacterium]|nr:hypothetical protein [Lachnospiraceae bacterium]